MRRSWVRNASIALGAVLLLSFLAANAQAIDPSEQARYETNLLRIEKLDAQLNAQILASRHELAAAYDPLVATAADLDEVEHNLRDTPGFVGQPGKATIASLVESYAQSSADKEERIERFKTENAILRNSLHYLPALFEDIVASRGSGEADDGVLTTVDALVRNVLLYNLTGDPETLRAIESQLDALRPLADLGSSDANADRLGMLTSHAQIILRTRPQVDALIAEILAVPTQQRVEELRQGYAREYERAFRVASGYRLALFAVALLLLGGSVYAFIRLRSATNAANAANAGLLKKNTELRQSEARKAAILQSALDCVISLGHDGVISEFNPAAEQTFGYPASVATGKKLADLVVALGPSGGAGDGVLRLAPNAGLVLGERLQGTGRRAAGAHFPLELAVVRIECDGPPTYTAYLRDISERKRAEETLQYQAQHDALTDLANRALLAEQLRQTSAAAQRNGSPMALLLMDLDGFKDVNDALGHHAGDLLLQQVAGRLRAALRAGDTIARLGGDEFAVLLPRAGAEEATAVGDKLLRVLAEPFLIEGHGLDVRASIGIAHAPAHGADAETLLRHADVAMYTAKRAQSGYTLYGADQDRDSATRLALVGELRQAIEQDQLTLYFQPKAEQRTQRVSGVEALVRWQHPQRGLIPPDQFIPLAEQTGLIEPLSRWVLGAALRQCRAWLETGLQLPVAVNLSMSSLQDRHLPETVADELSRWNVPPTWLCLEITESAVMVDPDRACEVLGRLRQLGVRIAIDDFGTGYSSLAYLKHLPVDQLKIDKSFTRHMVSNDSDLAIVRSTIDLAHNLGLQVIAEGVEDPATWDLLADLGCDEAQGYLLSRPLPAAELARWLAAEPAGAGRETPLAA